MRAGFVGDGLAPDLPYLQPDAFGLWRTGGIRDMIKSTLASARFTCMSKYLLSVQNKQLDTTLGPSQSG